MAEASPYTTVEMFGRAMPAHVPENAVEDQLRVRAYETYADLFFNVSSIFATVALDATGNPLNLRYIPAARSIVEATNRYLARGMRWVAHAPAPTSAVDPAAGDAQQAVADEAIAAAMAMLDPLFKRERFASKFLSYKRWMLVRGDAILHITADASKPEGTRLRITELHPGSYFPIKDPTDDTRIIGCYIVNVIRDDDGEEIAARLEYRKIVDDEQASEFRTPIGGIYTRLTFWELAGWDDRIDEEDLAPVPTPSRFNTPRSELMLAGTPLPAQITAIPIYHVRNNARGEELFGTSEVQGVESLLTGINQAASDQDVAVAMQGLGTYWTDSGRPKNAQGAEVPWVIAPASMLEIQPGTQIGRVQGLSTVEPSMQHIGLLEGRARESTATPDVAVGKVEVQVAQSGVALAIQFAPIVAKNEEKQLELGTKLDQMLYDLLNGWLPAYEGWTPNGVNVTVEFDDSLPVDEQAVVTRLAALVTAKIISAEKARHELTQLLGMEFHVDEAQRIADEGEAALDATGARMDAAISAGDGPPI